MPHLVQFLSETPDPETFVFPVETAFEVADLAEAMEIAIPRIQATGRIGSVDLVADADLCSDLAELLAWEDALPAWLEANPLPGQWQGRAMTDLSVWTARGVTTPHAYRAWQEAREVS